MCRQVPRIDSLSPNARRVQIVLRCKECHAYITKRRYCFAVEENGRWVFETRVASNVLYTLTFFDPVEFFDPYDDVLIYIYDPFLYCDDCNSVVGYYWEKLIVFPMGSTEKEWCFVLNRDALAIDTELI